MQLNDVPVKSVQSCAFKIGNTGYVYNDRYNQASNIWDLMCSFADDCMANASAFGDANFGYAVFGQKTGNGPNNLSNELWWFEPLDLTSNEDINKAEKTIQFYSDANRAVYINFPSPEVYSISVYDLIGRCESTESLQIKDNNFNWINKYTANGLHFI